MRQKNVVYKMVSSKKLAGWVGGWVGGWMDGRESHVKDCLQQSKIIKITLENYHSFLH
jgi:hypothetical protein